MSNWTPPPRDEEEDVRTWRVERLVEIGVPFDDAVTIARSLPRHRSWHDVEEAIKQGVKIEDVPELLAA